MRVHSPEFVAAITSPSREGRYVVAIRFPVGSIYLTSHADIPNVPGIVIHGAIADVSTVSHDYDPKNFRGEIGRASFRVIDRNTTVHNEFRNKLLANTDLCDRQVEFYVGVAGMDFTAFPRFTTQILQKIKFDKGSYIVECADLTRETRTEIFAPVFTTLRDTISATATTVPVYNTTKFLRVVHGPSYSDAPNATVGYIQVESEIIRYTGTTADTFTGCTRGALNTKAVEHRVDAATAEAQRTKVTEFIYLELPAVKIAWAILTGQLYGSANTLPPHWHVGIPTTLIVESDFTNIGADLWVPSDDTLGLPLSFIGPGKTTGKQFLEREIFPLLGAVPRIYSDGRYGIRRQPALLASAQPVATITDKNVVEIGTLEHAMDELTNEFSVEWSVDRNKSPRRVTEYIDTASQSRHNKTGRQSFRFTGLQSARHTDATIRSFLERWRDAYSAPPLHLDLTLVGSLSRLEEGDVCRVQLPAVRDYTGATVSLDRAMQVRRITSNYGARVSVELTGSTARPALTPINTAVFALPDAFYSSQGVALSSVVSMTGNTVNAGTYDLTGLADATAGGSIFYHLGDLIIPQTATIRVNQNIQFRVRGFATINGVIDGVGRGHPGVADAAPLTNSPTGTAGFIGQTQGADGMNLSEPGGDAVWIRSRAAGRSATAIHDAFPYFEIRYDGSVLRGLPTDLRGTSGGPGGKVDNGGALAILGGTGGASGAGVIFICRGMGFGASGRLDLSGTDGAPGTFALIGGNGFFSGGGAPGLSGGLLILLDGSSVSVPDVTGRFFGSTGQPGYLLPHTPQPIETFAEAREFRWFSTQGGPFAGAILSDVTRFVDSSNAMHRIQYIPAPETAVDDSEPPIPSPTSLVATPGPSRVELAAGIPQNLPGWVELRLYSSIDNNRSNAVLVWQGRSDRAFEILGGGTTRFYWASMYDTVEFIESGFFPVSSTGGVSGTAASGGAPGSPGAPGANARILFLDTDGETFVFEGAGVTPATINLFARRQNLSNAVTWTSSPTVTLGGSGDNRTLSATDFGALNSTTITATIVESSVTYTSSVIIKRQQTAAPTFFLSASSVEGTNQGFAATGTVNSTQGGGNHNASATPFNGVGPFTYAWTIEGSQSLPTTSIAGSTTQNPTWTAVGVADGAPANTQWRCTVTDTGNGGATAFRVINVSLTWIDLS